MARPAAIAEPQSSIIIPGRARRFADNHIDAQSFAFNTRQPQPNLAHHHSSYGEMMTTPDGQNTQRHQINVDQMLKGGYAFGVFNIFAMKRGDGSVREADKQILTPDDFWAPGKGEYRGVIVAGLNYYRNLLRARSDVLRQVTTRTELLDALEAEMIAIQLSAEGVHNLMPGDLEFMAAAGIRQISPWNDHVKGDPNELWSPSKFSYTDDDIGLTPTGRDALREAFSLGMTYDGAHGSKRSNLEAMDLSQDRPIVISHSGVYEVKPHKRNVDKDVRRAMKATGALLALPGSRTFVESLDKLLDQVEVLFDEDMGELVGFGMDFGGMGKNSLAEGLENAAVTPRNIDRGLEQRGFSVRERDNVLFNNTINFRLRSLPA